MHHDLLGEGVDSFNFQGIEGAGGEIQDHVLLDEQHSDVGGQESGDG